MAGITVSGGTIQINGMWFSTLTYQPPAYGRAISYIDTPVSNGAGITMQRNITDHGLLPGIWAQFTINCYFSDEYDPIPQPYRGQFILDRLMEFASYVATPLILYDPVINMRYRVMFGADGVAAAYAQGVARGGIDPQTLMELGPEYEAKVSLLEVPTPPGQGF